MPTAPTSERWKPLRAGLVDMFYYDVEEFHFHQGRLLLRGNNGTGKSKVLALTLPFLLDGELSPHRVEPDGDHRKRMEWNLLLDGKHPHPERLGYTWLEFGRLNADGSPEFRTIGCGLKAVKDRGIARSWFFVTQQRVGVDLHLISPSGTALTRDKLRDAVEGAGLVFDRAADYRRAVDDALFGLGEYRYAALVNLLIQLRQPQLSKKPDEKRLSRALTEALPPLSPALIATVADAFRGLDEERDALRTLTEARQAADDFLTHYRRYAAIAAKRKAAAPRQTHSRYEHLSRDLIDADTRHTRADADLVTARATLDDLAAQQVRLDARAEALRQSPEMRDAERLRQTGAEASRLAAHALRSEQERDRLAIDVGRVRIRATAADGKAEAAARELLAAGDLAVAASRAARCETAHLALVDGVTDPGQVRAAKRESEALAVRREQAVTGLERLLKQVAEARGRLAGAQADVDRLSAELQAAAERIGAAEEATDAARDELSRAYGRYLAELTELRIEDPDAVLAAMDSWAVTANGPNPATVLVDDAARAAPILLGGQGAELNGALRAARATAAELGAEIAKLEAGGHDTPPIPHTRGPQARLGRPGAPLWKVIDFAGAVPADHRAGLEGALEAAGILDAWVTPDGNLLVENDTVVLPVGPVAGPTCAGLLRPVIDRADPQAAALSDDVVERVLAAIGLGAGHGPAWVTVDGRWANGVLTGSYRKTSADYIGEGAREAARRAKLIGLRAELARKERQIDDLASQVRALTVRQDALAAEHRALPSDAPVREAHVRLAAEHGRRRELVAQHTRAATIALERQHDLTEARTRTDEFAGDVGLPTDAESLADVKAGVGEYRLSLARLWPAFHALREARETVADTRTQLAEAQQRLDAAIELSLGARAEADGAAEIHRVLTETAGAAVSALNQQFDEVRKAQQTRAQAEREVRGQERKALEERGKAEGQRNNLRVQLEEAAIARETAIREFRAFTATGLLKLALPDQEIPDPATEWAAKPAVLLAREVNARLESIDDGDPLWERIQRKVAEEHKLLSDVMARQGNSVGLSVPNGVMIVDVVFHGRRQDVAGLAGGLARESADRAELLSAKEREILENHLLNEVAGTLQELITDAESEVREMNAELESRPTSTGMRLRLIWKPAKDAPDGLVRVRDKLRQQVDAWAVADRASVGAFLQQQIARQHSDNPAAGWTEALTKALDYRGWHEFAIQRLQDGQWRSASGPASGGERVLAASIPLFAAASAHYKSAGNPYAPRLVALDEAFAGVDDDSRAKCLGLLATFDMDVVMTSEREWGCYPQVPGLAICQLSRRDGIDAVLVTTWRWDGQERRRTEQSVPSLPIERSAIPQGGLFDE
ncbi:hypothetical protein Acor_66790 [Acrocarpospora corrugata]|uniref:TIGR02680 family protein n=1 Tax=Acrocarpospora corrugata TaxID=35763 RepID=A0A5M3WC14_9ACTN|nr:TIGR02680 family protein [Acrocarpospora corrugata]GES04611.1 hypothetical protein Acor_66790 [Acrocarpospora corrugata]